MTRTLFLPKFSRPHRTQCQQRNVLGKAAQISLVHLWGREESFCIPSPTRQTSDSLPKIKTVLGLLFIHITRGDWQQVQECFQVILEGLTKTGIFWQRIHASSFHNCILLTKASVSIDVAEL